MLDESPDKVIIGFYIFEMAVFVALGICGIFASLHASSIIEKIGFSAIVCVGVGLGLSLFAMMLKEEMIFKPA